MMDHMRTLLIAVLSVTVIDGCGDRRAAPPAQEPDAPATPQRIISLIPSITETIVAFGVSDRLVARSRYDVDPALAHLPSIGQGLTPSIENLAALQPDLVIAWPGNPSSNVIERLQELGVAIYSPEIQSLADVRRVFHELGALLGSEQVADSLVASIDAGLEEVRAAVAGLGRPSVFYVIWYDPPTTTGSGNFVNDLIEIAGGRNVFADAPGLWPQISLEEVVSRQPDIVLFSQSEDSPVDITRVREEVGWQELDALRDGRAFTIDAN
ncbi:MAG TPA: helical backbone metal receptor, partial [Gemmatimonadota bacterium]|nr:helical backbone metal receptor [Gemmatimonadota bacterium]